MIASAMSSNVTLSRSPPPTTQIPLIRLSTEDDIDAAEGDGGDDHRRHNYRTGDGAAFSATAVRVVEALQTSGFLLVQSHHLPLDLQRRALKSTNNIFHRNNDDKITNSSNNELNRQTKKGVIHHPTDPKSYVMIDCQSHQSIAADIGHLTPASDGDDYEDTFSCDANAISSYIEALENVKIQLLELIAVGLNLPKEVFVNLHHRRNDALRLLQYHGTGTGTGTTSTTQQSANLMIPITSSSDEDEKKEIKSLSPSDKTHPRLRCKEHSDYGTITLLLTDGKPGLQAYVQKPTMFVNGNRSQSIDSEENNKNETEEGDDGSNNKRKRNHGGGSSQQDDEEECMWVDVPYIEGAIVVNIGSMLSEWTDGRLLATLHRVAFTNDDGSDSSIRTSLAFFADPDPDVSTNLHLGSSTDSKDDERPKTVAEYISWRSGGIENDRTGVAFTETEEKRIHPMQSDSPKKEIS